MSRYFSIYKVDIGSSRAFDIKFPITSDPPISLQHYLTARTPQVLKIINRGTLNDEIQIIRSTVSNTLNNMARPSYGADIATIRVPEESEYARKMRLGEA